MLIHWAYEMPETRILDAPGWARSTYFNIDATADPSVDTAMHSFTSDAGRKQKEKMVQALARPIASTLSSHTETRELPIYESGRRQGRRKTRRSDSTGGHYLNHGRDHIEMEGC